MIWQSNFESTRLIMTTRTLKWAGMRYLELRPLPAPLSYAPSLALLNHLALTAILENQAENPPADRCEATKPSTTAARFLLPCTLSSGALLLSLSLSPPLLHPSCLLLKCVSCRQDQILPRQHSTCRTMRAGRSSTLPRCCHPLSGLYPASITLTRCS